MSENDRDRDANGTNPTDGEGVALSPYDSDLRPPEGDIAPSDLELSTPDGYDESSLADDGVADVESADVESADGEVADVESADGEAADVEPWDAPPPPEEADAMAQESEFRAPEWAGGPSTEVLPESAASNAEPSGEPSTVETPMNDATTVRAEEAMGAGAAARGAAAVSAAVPGVAAGTATVSDDTLTSDAMSDTAVRRTSLLHPERAELPSNEPTRLRIDGEADARADNYGTTLPADDAALFEGAHYDRVPSRVGAHLWGLLAAIVLIPIAWYLISDAGARMTLSENAQWTTGAMNIAALLELLAGVVVLVAALLFARASSVGAFVMGGLLVLLGGAFVIVPSIVRDVLEPIQDGLRNFQEGLGGNIAHHLEADGSTGRIFILGVILIMVGVVSHGARRKGREEQRIRSAVERRRAREPQ